MKKSILAMVLSAIMFFSIPVYATPVSDFFAGYDIPSSVDIAVEADVQVKKASSSEFIDGPINVTKKSSEEWPTFDFRATIYMESVREAFRQYSAVSRFLIADDATLREQFANSPIYGEFVVSAKYPSSLSVPRRFLNAGEMSGFNDEAKVVFRELGRSERTQGSWKTLEIRLSVKNPAGLGDYITQGDLEANLDTYFPDFTLTCQDVETSAPGTFPVYGEMIGTTYIGGRTAEEGMFTQINYSAVQKEIPEASSDDLSATVSVVNKSSSSIGGGTTTPIDEVILSFSVSGDTTLVAPVSGHKKVSVNISAVAAPKREGFVFDGWYAEAACKTKLAGLVTFTKDTIVYAKWINVTVPEMFDATSHYAYLNGYEDGKIYPEKPISREEVSAVLHRLLTADFKSTLNATPAFSDVSADRWSAEAIFAMADGDFLKGYPDGTFDPSKPVTRAEFATIISRFYSDILKANHIGFKDIGGHWAEEYIMDASALALIEGYEDGTFKPDAYVSRAEAVTIINRILVRYVDGAGLCEGVKMWPDNSPSAWYYYQIIEASNAHAYTRREDGVYETWTALTK